jgi:nucleotide-binding universal stress UspA family protein
MIEEILVCLDGSPWAEKILSVAHGIAGATRARLAVLRVVSSTDELTGEETYLRSLARQYGAEMKFLVSGEPANAIIAELKRNPGALAALTTHGHTAWAEAILGGVAFKVMRNAGRPIILFRPPPKEQAIPKRITTLALALDGSAFAERLIPYAADLAKSLAARLLLLQALGSQPAPTDPNDETIFLIESSYLQRKAAAIKQAHNIEADWEVLHGEAADAICRYLKGMPETMLAITTHARRGLERAILGSAAGDCIRRAGVPILIYWPEGSV